VAEFADCLLLVSVDVDPAIEDEWNRFEAADDDLPPQHAVKRRPRFGYRRRPNTAS